MFGAPRNPEEAAARGRGGGAGIKAKGNHLLPQGSNTVQGKDVGALKVRERKFENGDKYRGGWLNGLPEGEGKYEWSDGSCYEGGWKAGHKHGVGKYTWNSGASYQGDWHNGFMHGTGTFEAPDGSKYQGGWREDLKHGLGRKIYANGDVYEGLWCNGKPDGPGRYIWVDFNEYDGEWRSGRLHGQGTFVWKTGERYDGEWRAGQEDGVGMFTFRDGSTYEGFWRKGKKHGVGIFRPAAALPSSAMRSLKGQLGSGRGPARSAQSSSQGASSGRSAFADATAAAAALPDEAAADYVQAKRPSKPQPSTDPAAAEGQQQPRLTHPGSAKSMSSMGQFDPSTASQLQSPRNRRDQVTLKEYNDGRLLRQQVLSPAQVAAISSALSSPQSSSSTTAAATQSSSSSSRQQVTPLGDVLYQDHSAYDLMVQLQLGIRWSVTSAALDYTSPAALHSELQPPDYATTVKQEFPRAGSRSTPVHPAADFVWKDYAPAAFRVLRELAGVEQHDFIDQLCGDQALRLLSPCAHSGAMFFLSADERFIVRTITCAEKKLLLSVLQRYAEHLRRWPNSLLVRFYGLHRVAAPPGGVGKKVRFLVMANIFCTQLPLQLRYDLKGCSKGRTAGPAAAAKGAGANVVLKDQDLQQRFKLGEGLGRRVQEQLEADTRLLSSLRVMDYSMLLGVHQRTRDAGSAAGAGKPPAGPGQQRHNFAEHSNDAGLEAAVSRMEAQLGRLQLDKWAESALLQLGRTNLLMGLAAAGSKPGGSTNRRGNLTRSPTLVLASRPKRNPPSRRSPAAAAPAAGTRAAKAAAAPADSAAAGMDAAAAAAAAGAVGAARDATSTDSMKLLQPLGLGVAAVAEPLQASSSRQAASSSTAAGAAGQQQKVPPEQAVVLYFGIIDILQAYTLKKRLQGYMRRVVSPANAISAVSPGFYATRFRAAMKNVFK